MKVGLKSLAATIIAVASLGMTAEAARAASITFQEGVDGYAGTQDTWFSHRATGGEVSGNPNTNYIRTAFWGAPPASGANQQALLRFDDMFGGGASQIPLGATIDSAVLTLIVPADVTFSDGEANEIRQMLVDWTETDAYNAAPWSGQATQQIDFDDVEAASVAVANSLAFAAGDNKIPQGTAITLDVASIVQNWSDGAGNYGFVFQSLGLAAGDGLFVASSEYAVAASRPALAVEYTATVVPEPSSLALVAIGLAGWLGAARRKNRV